MALCREGVDEKSESINICKRCFHCIKTIRKTPRLAVANNLDFGAIPPELQDLTWAEERVISLYRICVHVLNLRGHESPSQRSEESILHQQLKVKGHAFCVSQDIPSLNGVLPLHPKDLPQILQVSPCCNSWQHCCCLSGCVFGSESRISTRSAITVHIKSQADKNPGGS